MDLWDEDVSGISDEMSGTIDTLGRLLGQEERAEELISGIDGIIKDIRSLVGESDPRAYLAGANYGGTNTLNTTLARYDPFTLTGLHNAYTGGEKMDMIDRVLNMPLEELFDFKEPGFPLPERARMFESRTCEICRESAREDMMRFQNGKIVCLDCFKGYDRGWM